MQNYLPDFSIAQNVQNYKKLQSHMQIFAPSQQM